MKKYLLLIVLLALWGLNVNAQTQLITNGDFSSTTGWATSTTGSGNFYYNSNYPTQGHSNPGYAYASSSTGDAQTNLNAYLEQALIIPSGSSSATLSYWVKTTLSGTSTGLERIFVYLYDYNTSSTYTVANTYFSSSMSSWTQYSFSIPSSLYGHSLVLGFNAKSSTTATTIRVDDVSLTYVAGSTCAYSISPSSISPSSPSGSGSVSVTATSGCSWTAVSNSTSWLTVTIGSSGTGSGTVGYSYAINTSSSPRTGTITIAGKSFTVTQAGSVSCSYSISPSSVSPSSSSGSSSVSVTATSGCTWTAVSNNTSWLTVTSGSSGTGNGTVGYSYITNSSSSSRTGTITIAGKTFTVTQSGTTTGLLHGVDISSLNGTGVSWSSVYSTNHSFAYVRATKGIGPSGGGSCWKDPKFDYNMTNSNPNGVVLGAYHVALPVDNSGVSGAVAEANYFYSVASSYIGIGFLPPALDLEDPGTDCNVNTQKLDVYYNTAALKLQLAQWVNTWCNRIYTLTGVWPVLYVTRCHANLLVSYYTNGTINFNIKLWIADYPRTAGSPAGSTVCGSGSNWNTWPWIFHQYFVPSVNGAGTNPTEFADPGMDQDVFYGTQTDFNNLIGGTPIARPSNDDCIGSELLTPSTTCSYISRSTSGATQSVVATSPCNSFTNGNADDDVWFKFSATAGQTYTVQLLNGTSFDGVLDLRTGSCNGISVACDDQTGSTGILNTVTISPSTSQIYYVRAYNYGAGSGSAGGNFQICVVSSSSCTTPTTQASAISFSGVGTNSMTANWTNGNGSRRVVKMNTSNSFTAPGSGTEPVANTSYGGSGEQVVYNGTGNSIAVTGLSAGTTYWFRVYETNCTGSSLLYSIVTATNNPNSQSTTASTCTAPNNGIISPSNPTVVAGSGINLTVTANGTAPFTYQWYWWNGSVWTALTNSSPYSGTTTQMLTINPTSTSMNGFAYNCLVTNSCGSQNDISYVELAITSSCTAPTIQVSAITFSGVGNNLMTANWTNGNGSRRIVKVNTSNSFTAPGNGTDPTANASYGGSGEQVVYNGTNNSVSVTGLSAGTTYWFRVYEANCTGSSSLYSNVAAINNPNSQSTTASTCTAPNNGIISPSTPTVTAGSGITLSVTANGTAPFTYQWYWWNISAWTALTNSSPYSGATTQSLTINPTSTSMNGYSYSCVVYNSCGFQNDVYYVILAVNSSCTTPTTQASAITFSGVGNNLMTANWTNGNGSRRIVKVNTSNSFTAPGNGTDPTANASYGGSGEQVVYNGTNNSVSVTGLSAGTTYWFRVYEANCTGSSSLYSTVAAINNPNSQSTTSSSSQLDDDKDGIMNDKDVCPNTTIGTIVDYKGCPTVPATNFKLEISNPTCQSKNNGKLTITATANNNYIATLNGTEYPFVNNVLSLDNLSPNTYTICVKVPSLNNFAQCFEFIVKDPPKLTAKTTMGTKGSKISANILIETGTAPYTVEINGNVVAETYDTKLNLEVKNGDVLDIKSSIKCEGKISQKVNLLDKVTLYPNPATNYVDIIIPSYLQKNTIKAQMVDSFGKTIVSKEFKIVNELVRMPMDNLPTGLYIIYLQFETTVTLKVIKK